MDENGKKFLHRHILLAVVIIIVLLMVSEAWNSVFVKFIEMALQRQPTLFESLGIAVVLTIILLVLVYIFHVTLVSFF